MKRKILVVGLIISSLVFAEEFNNKNKNLYGLTFWAKDYKQIQSNNEIKTYNDILNNSFVLENISYSHII